MEELRQALCRLMRDQPLAPFESETIVVSSQGMERWLAMGLAEELGVAANVVFPFPRAWIEQVIDLTLPELQGSGARFSRESLRWVLLELFPSLAAEPALAPVRAYLDASRGSDELASFADRVAHVFDQYAVYRPELVAAWENGQGSGWQPIVWRALVRRLGPVHLGRRAGSAIERLAARVPIEGLPRRVSLFGTAALPPIFVEVLAALSAHADVHAYLLCPSDAVWQGAEPSRLGRSLGRVEHDLREVLRARTLSVEGERCFVDPGEQSVLAAVKSELFHARAPRSEPERLPFPADDRSLAIHVCHSPMRELEVLRDQLLDAFGADPTLRPEDVIVMMPDVETYGPYVDAVFGSEPDGRAYIPYRLTDRSERSSCPLADALLSVLALLSGRFAASEVMDLLQLEAVRSRFGVDERELPRLAEWVRQGGARSFLDRRHRGEAGLPDTAEHTWEFALDRLLLGYAMPGRSERSFAGVLPFDGVEGSAALALGSLAELVATLAELRRELGEARPIAAWRDAILGLVGRMFRVSARDAWQERVVRDAMNELCQAAERVAFQAPVERRVFERALSDVLVTRRAAHDFMSGGVTFSALLPMRSVPFRLVCLVGLNDGDFPRSPRSPAFDEIARSPEIGDRSVRDDDRHSFLEALLSARERLIVTYVGRGIQDDGVRPPSVVVSELLATLDSIFQPPREPEEEAQRSFAFAPHEAAGDVPKTASARLCLVHPLQAVSPRYFGADRDRRLFSHMTLELEGARARASGELEELVPFSAPLVVEPEAEVGLDDLCTFFEHPIRHLFERECGVRLRQSTDPLPDREPLRLSDLERHALGSFLLARELDGVAAADTEALARAAGLLPHGTLGQVAHARENREATLLTRESQKALDGGCLPPWRVEASVGGHRLSGALRGLHARAQVVYTFSRGRAKTLVSLWIRHLALAATRSRDLPERSLLVARSQSGPGIEIWELSPVRASRASDLLAELVALRESGRKVPLCFFPDAAFAYVEALRRHGDPEKALGAAISSWQRGQAFSGVLDPYHRHLFGDRDPFAPGFALAPDVQAPRFDELARSVLGPMFDHLDRREVLA